MISKNRKNVIFVSIIVSIFVGSVLVASLNNVLSTPQSVQAINTSINIWINGDKIGAIDGDSKDSGREGTIECLIFSHNVVSPRDAASGLPTGKRQHKPVAITKEIDKATPLLMQAWITNDALNVEFKFFRPDPSGTGQEDHYFTIILETAKVASISHYSPSALEPASAESPNPSREVITLVYASITWIWEETDLEITDTWADDPA